MPAPTPRSAPPPPCQAVGIIHWGRAWAIPLPGAVGREGRRRKRGRRRGGGGAVGEGEGGGCGGERGSTPAHRRRDCVLGGLCEAGAGGLSNPGGAPYGNVSALLAVPLALSLTERRRKGGGGVGVGRQRGGGELGYAEEGESPGAREPSSSSARPGRAGGTALPFHLGNGGRRRGKARRHSCPWLATAHKGIWRPPPLPSTTTPRPRPSLRNHS